VSGLLFAIFHGVYSVLWFAELFVINEYLVACHSHNLFGMERLVVIYRPYL
jgi:hypothetical protein